MKKRGVSSVSLILFSIFSIILSSGAVSAGCSGTLQCSRISVMSTCEIYYTAFRACDWTTSCVNVAGATCSLINDQNMCTAVGCTWSSTQCTYISASATPCCNTDGTFKAYGTNCSTINAFFMCDESTDIVRIEGEQKVCSGNSASCNGPTQWVVMAPSYQSCATQNGCIDDYFFPNVCACAGSTSWLLPPTTAYTSSCSSCAVPPSPGFPGCAGTCTDTDGGLGYTTYGYTYLAGYGSSTSQYDSCSSSTTLNEKYCVGGVQSTSSYSCTNLGSQYSCSGERCVCTPNCVLKSCGPDGCGGTCGTCLSTQTCNTATGQCQDNCMVTGAVGCTSVGTASNQCCSGVCIEGTCRSSCTGYTSSQNRCSSTGTSYTNYGICTSSAGCDTTIASLSGGTYYSDCSGRSDGTSADRDSLAGGYSANGICCGGSAVATPTGFGSSCDGSDADYCMEGTILCTGSCSDSTGSTYENTVALCHDGSDNDCDGATDCSDSQCVGIASENTASSCADGVDNDCDGATDCSDSGCTSLTTSTTCDGSDADSCREGYTYVCGGCSDTTGSTYENTVALCHDGSDNDCDGATDCSDSQCVGIASENTASSCADGVDNDCDGATDCSDSGCTSLTTSTTCDGSDADSCREGYTYVCGGCSDTTGSTYENTFALCTDSSDNDCDGATDCSDSQCSGLSGTSDCDQDGYCAGAVRTCSGGILSACSKLPIPETCNGIDDNCDGLVDNGITCTCTNGDTRTQTCGTGACQRTVSQTCVSGAWTPACVPGTAGTETTTATCSDSSDNDCDGATDCSDSGCTSLTTSTTCDGSDADFCREGSLYLCGGSCSDTTGSTYENTFALCTDSSDNDCDGATDCSDSQCSGLSGTSDCDQDGYCAGAVRTCSGGTLSACSKLPIPETCNGIDDNCDGLVDNGITCTCTNGATRTITCGVGACQRTVSQTCVSGAWTPACVPGTPGTEICGNGIDEDCNGVDAVCSTCTNGATQQCGTTDVGECSYGTQTCVGGSWSSCVGEITSVPEICGDGLDNDCDGTPDDGCAGVCGDEKRDSGEECDDGDNTPGDGCDGSCNIEDGWTCVGDIGEVSICSHKCSFQAGSLHWSSLQVLEGEDVRMEFTLIGDCNGEEITFEVREDDLLSSSYVATPAPIIYGPSSTYGTWTTIIVADSGGPEYYFVARITSTGESTSSSTNYANELKVLQDNTCYLPLEGRNIAYCSDYDETLCEFDVCGVGVNITLLDPTIQCGDEYECGCIWNSDTDTCGYVWNATTSNQPTSSDFDGDGILNGDDPDFDGDGVLDSPFDSVNPNGDIDGDGIININDPDMDGDGILNGDDPDFDGDGTLDFPFDSVNPNGDIDGDGIININDPDMDGDGIPNGNDPDFDGDGVPDGYYSGIDPNGDIDGDGIININDPDMDGDGILNGDDFDFDGNGNNDGRYIGFVEDSEFEIGTCSYFESGGGGECTNGVRVWTLSSIWTWSPENVQYFLENGVYLDPLSKESKCQDINRQLECSPGAQVNFFGIYQLVIVIAIVALIYVLYILRKRKLHKKKKIQHKVKHIKRKKRR